MQALILDSPRCLRFGEAAEPELGSKDVLIRIKACGICGSDVHGYDGSSGRRIPPLIMGHEAAGVIAMVGAEVRGFAPGDKVTFDSTIYCGHCDFCRKGAVNLCESRQVVGVSCEDYRRHGAFAEYVAVPEHIVYKLPDSFPIEQAALIEAVSIAVHAVKISKVTQGTSAVVIGVGMIGLLTIQALRHFGCSAVFAVDVDVEKLRLAKQFGADATFHSETEDVASGLRRATNGQGADYAVEAVGAQASILTAIECVRRGGGITLIGNLARSVEIPLQKIVTQEIRLLGSCASAGEYPECISLMANGAINVVPLISAVVPLSEGAFWFDRLYARERGLMKVILAP